MLAALRKQRFSFSPSQASAWNSPATRGLQWRGVATDFIWAALLVEPQRERIEVGAATLQSWWKVTRLGRLPLLVVELHLVAGWRDCGSLLSTWSVLPLLLDLSTTPDRSHVGVAAADEQAALPRPGAMHKPQAAARLS